MIRVYVANIHNNNDNIIRNNDDNANNADKDSNSSIKSNITSNRTPQRGTSTSTWTRFRCKHKQRLIQ